MRVSYVVETFPKVSETFIQNQITGLMDRDHEVDIFSLYRSKEEVVHDDVKRYGLLEKTHYLSEIPFGTDSRSNEYVIGVACYHKGYVKYLCNLVGHGRGHGRDDV